MNLIPSPRRRQLRWMLPIAVALDGDDSIVPTIHPVRGQQP